MIDIDEYIEMWNDHLLGSEGMQDLMNALIAEVKRLRKELEQCWEYISHIENHDIQSLADDSYKEERDRLRGKLNE